MNKCKDCKIEISKKAKRCTKCHLKRLNYLQQGINHPNYIDGRTNKKYYCINCNKEISYQNWKHGSKMCHSCSAKINPRQYRAFGYDNPNCKGMITKKLLFCKDCGKKLGITARYTKTKYCIYCVNKGKRSGNYINGGGNTPYPLEFNYIKKIILKRDNCICQKCRQKGTHVHHIDYNKENCNETNLITLCGKCNLKVNNNRDYWFAYFTYIIKGDYLWLW
jgi:hypothetical protein